MKCLADIVFQLVLNTIKVQPATVELCSLTFVEAVHILAACGSV